MEIKDSIGAIEPYSKQCIRIDEPFTAKIQMKNVRLVVVFNHFH